VATKSLTTNAWTVNVATATASATKTVTFTASACGKTYVQVLSAGVAQAGSAVVASGQAKSFVIPKSGSLQAWSLSGGSCTVV
jgi:hypothetical protein